MHRPVDPDLLPVLGQIREAGDPDYARITAGDARRSYRESRLRLRGVPPDVARVEDLSCPGPGGPIPVRLYRGIGTDPGRALPVLVFYHGGGWVVGDLDTHDVICRALANAGRCAVVSVDYRLAPEHPFPAAVEDALASAVWVARESGQLGVDRTRIAVGGDSAGGNLAAVVALGARGQSGLSLVCQMLLYPAVDQRMASAAFRRFDRGLALTSVGAAWFRDQYLQEAQRLDPRASPLLARDFAGLPRAFVLTVGHDPLAAEGRAYAEALENGGVRVAHLHVADQMHGCLTMTGIMRAPWTMLESAGLALRAAFEEPRTGDGRDTLEI